MKSLILILALGLSSLALEDLEQVPASDWIQLFNGADLTDWVPAISGFPAGEDPYGYFYVKDSILWVDYSNFNRGDPGMMGTLASQSRKFSYFLVRAVYQFWGEQAPGGPGWARQNNGILFHTQSMESLGLNDNYPTSSMECQLLGEDNNQNDDGTTANLCTLGATVEVDGKRDNYWCLKAAPRDITGLEWVRAEVLVLADSIVKHIVEGDTVLTYTNMIYKGDSKIDPDLRGKPMKEGYIAIQAESAPAKFKTIEVLDLAGCTDPLSPGYREYFIKSDESKCTGKFGCMNPASSNYDPEAGADDGSCLACTNPEASNYDTWCDTHDCADNGSCQAAGISMAFEGDPAVFWGRGASRVRIEVSAEGPFTVRVLDTRGKEMDLIRGRGPVSSHTVVLPSAGIYFLEANSPRGKSVKRILNF